METIKWQSDTKGPANLKALWGLIVCHSGGLVGKNFCSWSNHIGGKCHCALAFEGKSLNYEPSQREVKGQ